MIHGTGIDIVEVKRIDSALQRWGDRFAMRIFSRNEKEYCCKQNQPEIHFAARFAAKEAFIKAIHSFNEEGIAFSDVEVMRTPTGIPTIACHGTAQKAIEKENIKKIFVSLAHTDNYAVATVIMEK